MAYNKALTRIYHRVSGLGARRTLRSLAQPYTHLRYDLNSTLQEICNTFVYEPHNIYAFEDYLQRDDSFSLTDDFDDTHCIRITSNGETTFRAAFGLMNRDGSHPSQRLDFHVLRLIRIAMLEPERRIALVTLRGGDAKRALNLMLKLLRDDLYWNSEMPDIPCGDRDTLLPSLLLGLGHRTNSLPSMLLCSKEDITAEAHPFAYGSFAYVYGGKLGDKDVALKHPWFNTSMTQEALLDQSQYTLRECLIWSPLDHPNVVPLLAVNSDLFNGAPCMVSPLYKDLLKIMKLSRRNSEYLDKQQLNLWILNIAVGLAYLHSRCIVHGDLRADNVLVDENGVAMIADLGLAFFADVDSWKPNVKTVDSHSSPWYAPELERSLEKSFSAARTFATDVFAFGCVCLEIYTTHAPFEGRKSDLMADLRPSTPHGQAMDEGLWEVVKSCLVDDPASRPTMAEVSKRISLLSREWSL